MDQQSALWPREIDSSVAALPTPGPSAVARRPPAHKPARDAATGTAEIYLLDATAPARDGLPRISRLAVDGPVAVIMLPRTDPDGGPHHNRPLTELAARLAAALAPADATPPGSPCARSVFRFGRTWLDLEAARLTDDDGRVLPLTEMEFALLKFFAENRGRVLNRDQLLEGAHGRPWEPFDRSIDIRISRIRRKIEANPEKPEAIRTVRGIGYVYDPK